MTLAHPDRLWLLAALPPLALIAAVGGARRVRDWIALGQTGAPGPERTGAWLSALILIVAGLAGPRWGWSNALRSPLGRDVVLAVDVSRSMGALDAVPDRLGVAVEAAASLVRSFRVGADRVAIVAFAGRGVLRCPLTADLGAVLDRLDSLRPGAVRPGGTDLGAALDAAGEAFDDQERAGGRAVVVFSDGEDHAGRWLLAANRLRARGVPVHAVAIGDAAIGHPVPADPDDPSEPLHYRGAEVRSRRSDVALAAVARETGGAFVPLGLATMDLGNLFLNRIEPVSNAWRTASGASQPAERFGPFLVAGLGFVVVACRPSRPSRVSIKAWAVVLVSAVAAATLGASPGDDPVEVVASGRVAYDAGTFEDALAAFRHAARLAPSSAAARYNVAAALFQIGRFDEARASYREARTRTSPDSLTRTKIDYALGNTALALGDPKAAIAHYNECLSSPASGAEADSVRRLAALNRKFAEDQAHPAATPDEDLGDAPKNLSPRSTDKGDAKGNPAGSPDRSADGGTSPPDRRGAGEAGGGPTSPRPGTPEERLAQALDHVREARDRRLADPVEKDAPDALKNW